MFVLLVVALGDGVFCGFLLVCVCGGCFVGGGFGWRCVCVGCLGMGVGEMGFGFAVLEGWCNIALGFCGVVLLYGYVCVLSARFVWLSFRRVVLVDVMCWVLSGILFVYVGVGFVVWIVVWDG